MEVLLTFDVEVWCNGWESIEADFPDSFERYVFGHSRRDGYALPRTLDTLARHGLKGIFFVEPLFAARFGVEYLATIVRFIEDAGQEVQLHLHPEWTDEARPALLPGTTGKRQHLTSYSLAEQQTLIAHGLRLLREAGCKPPVAFRAGSFACNPDTFAAVRANGLRYDCSINPAMPESTPGDFVPAAAGYCGPFEADGLGCIPLSSFRDGFGRPRHAQIGACSTAELVQALDQTALHGWPCFVLLSHSFELMKPASSAPDTTVVRRFEQLCAHLAHQRSILPTGHFADNTLQLAARPRPLPAVSMHATTTRLFEQALRHLP